MCVGLPCHGEGARGVAQNPTTNVADVAIADHRDTAEMHEQHVDARLHSFNALDRNNGVTPKGVCFTVQEHVHEDVCGTADFRLHTPESRTRDRRMRHGIDLNRWIVHLVGPFVDITGK